MQGLFLSSLTPSASCYSILVGTPRLQGKGYFVSPVGINEEIIRKYIELQEKEDAGQVQEEIFRQLGSLLAEA